MDKSPLNSSPWWLLVISNLVEGRSIMSTHPACSCPLWTLSMCSTYFSCHWAAMSCLKTLWWEGQNKQNKFSDGCLPAWFCQDKFVQNSKDEAMEQDGVEKNNQPGCFVAHNEPHKGQNYLVVWLCSNYYSDIPVFIFQEESPSQRRRAGHTSFVFLAC